MDASSNFANLLPTSPTTLYKLLEDLKIKYEVYEHTPFFTVNEAKKHRKSMHGFHTKNLFLRDKKKKNYLVIAHEDRVIDLTRLTERIKSARLSFGSKERLFEELGVFPGAVTPLSVINNSKKDINIFLDSEMLGENAVFCHPLVNDRTISFSYANLLTFFDYLKLPYERVNLIF
tara:strand:+ start:113 stop:637 length:525 start_codon:yes stop_codon:yes gene_type:complete